MNKIIKIMTTEGAKAPQDGKNILRAANGCKYQ